jgi:hypothetical protein
LYGQDANYAALPADFALYSPYDQHRIAARMLAILEAAQHGTALDAPPLKTGHVRLHDALQRITALAEA